MSRIKAVLLALLLLVSVARPASAAFANVAHVTAQSSGGGTFTSSDINTTGADTIFVVKSWYQGGTEPTLTDSVSSTSNTWVCSLASYTEATVNSERLCYAKNATVGANHNFTMTGAVAYAGIAVLAVSGGHLTSPADQHDGLATSGVNYTGHTITPSEDNEIVIVGLGTTGDTISMSGYTVYAANYNAGNAEGVAIGFKIQTTAGSENPSWTVSNQITDLARSISSFKVAGAAPSGPPVGSLMLLGVGR